MPPYQSALRSHYGSHWQGQPVSLHTRKQFIHQIGADFSVLEFPPSAVRTMWTYATCGMSSLQMERPIELHLFSAMQCEQLVDLLTAVAHYHQTEQPLDLGHTINFGIPWQAGSTCSYGLISLPYLDGPALEEMPLDQKRVSCYWLLPITKAERDFKRSYGLEALEEKFDEAPFDYLSANRRTVV
ncbi:suppressor of fused domain protein [Hymenobacter sp. NBH84]|nr:suppressor of fused domain protein [Hymenobacter sp. NBH84]